MTSDYEAWIISSLSKISNKIFEFGTCSGKTTYLMGLNSNADSLIIDLEDGCPADKKILAREELINLLKERAFTKPVFIRVNDAMEAIGREDIDAISPYQDQIEAIILPKTQSFDFSVVTNPSGKQFPIGLSLIHI